MRIFLNEDDIQMALITYISNQGLNITGKDINVKISGRSDTGYNAELDLSPAKPEVEVKQDDEPTPRKPEEVVSKVDAALVEDSTEAEGINWSDSDEAVNS